MKRLEEAIALDEQILADRQRLLGPDHPDTLISQHNIAAAYESAGMLDRAMSRYEQTLADRERVLGPGHPDTAQTREYLKRAQGQIASGS